MRKIVIGCALCIVCVFSSGMKVIKGWFEKSGSSVTNIVPPVVIPPATNSPAGQYVHVYADDPINAVANKGPEVSGVEFNGCDIRFLANDSHGDGYFINEPKGCYTLSKDQNGNVTVTGADFEKNGAKFRYAGFKPASSSSPLRTENPAVISKADWKVGDKTTGRFFWQTVK